MLALWGAEIPLIVGYDGACDIPTEILLSIVLRRQNVSSFIYRYIRFSEEIGFKL